MKNAENDMIKNDIERTLYMAKKIHEKEIYNRFNKITRDSEFCSNTKVKLLLKIVSSKYIKFIDVKFPRIQ